MDDQNNIIKNHDKGPKLLLLTTAGFAARDQHKQETNNVGWSINPFLCPYVNSISTVVANCLSSSLWCNLFFYCSHSDFSIFLILKPLNWRFFCPPHTLDIYEKLQIQNSVLAKSHLGNFSNCCVALLFLYVYVSSLFMLCYILPLIREEAKWSKWSIYFIF